MEDKVYSSICVVGGGKRYISVSPADNDVLPFSWEKRLSADLWGTTMFPDLWGLRHIPSFVEGRRFNLGQHVDFGTVIRNPPSLRGKQQRKVTIYIHVSTQSRWFLKVTFNGSEVRIY